MRFFSGLSRLQKAVKSMRARIAEMGEAQNTDCTEKLVGRDETSRDSSMNTEEESLEDLIRGLHQQIKDSDWLLEHTAEKWAAENPELAKVFLNRETNQTEK